jgi:hypothetical protein
MFASNNSNIDQNNKDPEHMAIDSEGKGTVMTYEVTTVELPLIIGL